MITLTVLYGYPEDPVAFEDYYAHTHTPLVRAAGLDPEGASKVMATPDGSELPYYRMFQARFSHMEALKATMDSKEGQAVQEDIGNFATGGATVFISE